MLTVLAVLLVVGVLAAVGAVILVARGHLAVSSSTGRSPTPDATSPHRSSPPPPVRVPIGVVGTFAVRQASFDFVDHSRTWVDDGRVIPRQLRTVVRIPVLPAGTTGVRRVAGPFPLVVFAPGFIQCAGAYAPLLRTWASAGYVVAGVEFPRTNCDVASTADEADLVNQPADMSYVISRILRLSARSGDQLSGLVNPMEVAVAGHSDGGDTVAALVGNTCCIDERVVAAIVLAGAEWPPLGGAYFAKATPPVLFVQGSADTINPPAASLQLYQADDTGVRYYLDIYGAGHLTPYEGSTLPEGVVAQVTTAFLDRYVVGKQAAGAEMTHYGNVPGVSHLFGRGEVP